MYCKDCKYWEQHHGARNKVWSTCNKADRVEYDESIAGDTLAYYADADDDSGLDAGVRTGPMFGCIQFKAK